MSSEEIIQISVAGLKIGINGLKPAIEHVTDVKEIARLGVFATPSLIINDELKASAVGVQFGINEIGNQKRGAYVSP